MSDLMIADESIGPWRVAAVSFKAATQSLAVPVLSIVGNSVPTSERGKQRLAAWKTSVVTCVKTRRGPTPWDSRLRYAISVGFSFHPAAHGNQPLDVENFTKPSLDALAAGLFCMDEQDPASIPRYDYDDSNFLYLFVHRLPDAQVESDEGAAFYVSAT